MNIQDGDSMVGVHDVDECGRTTLMYAALSDRLDVVDAILNMGADVNKKCNLGVSTLMYAAMNDFDGIVELLLRRGADVNACANNGLNALQKASENGHNKVVKILLANGADVNYAVGVEELTALMMAAHKGHAAVITTLLKNGADIDKIDADGNTALMKAAMGGRDRIITILLDKGASVDQENCNKNSAMKLAIRHQHQHVVATFLSRGVLSGTVGDKKAFFKATKTGSDALVDFLLADKDDWVGEWLYALLLAAERNEGAIVIKLLNAADPGGRFHSRSQVARLTATLSRVANRHECALCGVGKFRTKRCAGCQAVLFCSAECQRRMWSAHKQLCRALQSDMPR
eukprot:TRINITY_DN6100_c0_g1_i1.p1 TRINITY_DN6100_c0_g1~~TRINITY_DN6100_c0_g1_i1.p1  ORF type:complete len:345 (-),score=73.63 TRINITY_DN6100_c0_g1_i1:56-1090(-)